MQIQTSVEEAGHRKSPEQVVIAIVKDAQGKYNPITVSWSMFTSHEPAMIAIAIGRGRYSLDAIRNAGEFVVSYPAASMEKEAVLFGTKSGRDADKLKESQVQVEPTTVVDGSLLADAVANFECRLEAELAVGDHVIFVGKVVAAHVNQDETITRLYTLGNGHMGGVSAQ